MSFFVRLLVYLFMLLHHFVFGADHLAPCHQIKGKKVIMIKVKIHPLFKEVQFLLKALKSGRSRLIFCCQLPVHMWVSDTKDVNILDSPWISYLLGNNTFPIFLIGRIRFMISAAFPGFVDTHWGRSSNLMAHSIYYARQHILLTYCTFVFDDFYFIICLIW